MPGEKIHGECYWCKSELCGTVIEVIGRHYHYRCFYCCKCRNPIGGKDFRMRDERFFCIDCYSKAFERCCAECGEYIQDDKYIEALDSYYHCEHFVCFRCKKEFPDNRFIKKEIYYKGEQRTRPFCVECNIQLKKELCTSCHKPLGQVKAFDEGHFYHDFCWLHDHASSDSDYSSDSDSSESETLPEDNHNHDEETLPEEDHHDEETLPEEDRLTREEIQRREEEERRRRDEEERSRNEEMSRKRDEERKQHEEERKQREEEKRMKEEEERNKKEEEKRKKEEEKRMKEELKREEELRRKEEEQKREMVDGYKTKARNVDFYDETDFETKQRQEEEKREIPHQSISSPPPQPKSTFSQSEVMKMLSESYAPMKSKNGNAITESFVDYNKDNGEIETIDEGDDDEVDEVRMSNQSLNYDDEQRRVSELPNDQLKKYPYSILVKKELPYDVDAGRKEYHLTDEEFKEVFEMDKMEYEALAKWKRNDLRKKAGLF